MHTTPFNIGLLDDEVVNRFKINVSKTSLMIPLFNNHGIRVETLTLPHNFYREVSRSQGKGYKHLGSNSPSQTGILYNSESLARKSPYILITIGIAAVWRIWQYGYPDVIGLLSPSINIDQMKVIDASVAKCGTLWLITDGTEHKLAAAERVRNQLSRLRITKHVFHKDKAVVELTPREMRLLFA